MPQLFSCSCLFHSNQVGKGKKKLTQTITPQNKLLNKPNYRYSRALKMTQAVGLVA